MSTIRTVAGAATAITAALLLSACGSGDAPSGTGTPAAAPAPAAPPTSAPAPDAVHNQADIAFVNGMIPHHSQAVAMAEQAPARAENAQVTALAARIEQAQGPEIAQMRGLLAAWGAPETPGGEMPGMDHGQMSGMSGMMTDGQMQQLGQARGAAFDRMFLQMMIEHHEGAVEMARTELNTGQNPQAKQLAQTIIDAQQSEIAEMKQLLTSA